MKKAKKAGFLKVFENKGEHVERPLLDDNATVDDTFVEMSLPKRNNQVGNRRINNDQETEAKEKPNSQWVVTDSVVLSDSAHIGELKVKPQPGKQHDPHKQGQQSKSSGFLQGLKNKLTRNDKPSDENIQEDIEAKVHAPMSAAVVQEPTVSSDAGYTQFLIGGKEVEASEDRVELTTLHRSVTAPVSEISDMTMDSRKGVKESRSPGQKIRKTRKVRMKAPNSSIPHLEGKRISLKRRGTKPQSDVLPEDQIIGGGAELVSPQHDERPAFARSLSDNSMMPSKDNTASPLRKESVHDIIQDLKSYYGETTIPNVASGSQEESAPSESVGKIVDSLIGNPRRLVQRFGSERNLFANPLRRDNRQFDKLDISNDSSGGDDDDITGMNPIKEKVLLKAFSKSQNNIDATFLGTTHHRSNLNSQKHGTQRDSLRSSTDRTGDLDVRALISPIASKQKLKLQELRSDPLSCNIRGSLHSPRGLAKAPKIDDLRGTVHTSMVSKTPIGRKVASQIVNSRKPVANIESERNERPNTEHGSQSRRKSTEMRRTRVVKRVQDSSNENGLPLAKREGVSSPRTPKSGFKKRSLRKSPTKRTPVHRSPTTSASTSPNNSGHSGISSDDILPPAPLDPEEESPRGKDETQEASVDVEPVVFTWKRAAPSTRRASLTGNRRVEKTDIASSLAEMLGPQSVHNLVSDTDAVHAGEAATVIVPTDVPNCQVSDSAVDLEGSEGQNDIEGTSSLDHEDPERVETSTENVSSLDDKEKFEIELEQSRQKLSEALATVETLQHRIQSLEELLAEA